MDSSRGPELGAKMFPASHSSSYKSDDNNRESTGLSSSTTYSMRESHTLCSVETYKSHKAETDRRIAEAHKDRIRRKHKYYEKIQNRTHKVNSKRSKELDSLEFLERVDSLLTRTATQIQAQKTIEAEQVDKEQKRSKLWKTWDGNIRKPLSRSIQHSLEEQSGIRRNRQRRKEYQKFLESCKRNASICLDDIDESSYDPFILNRTAVKLHVNSGVDPLKVDIVKRLKEKKLLDETATMDIPKPVFRESLPAQRWTKVALALTPWGKEELHKARKPLSSPKKTCVGDDFNVDRSYATFRSEAPATKRLFPQSFKPTDPLQQGSLPHSDAS